jgi:hypothetical protein
MKLSCNLWHKKLKLKIVSIFDIIQNYDNFSKQNEKFEKIYTFWNFHNYSTITNTKYYVYFLCKRIHQKILSYEKVKRTKKRLIVLL